MNTSDIYLQDAEQIAGCDSVMWSKLDNSVVLITGATGLIGSTIVRGLLRRNETEGVATQIYALARNESKFQRIFSKEIGSPSLHVIYGDVCTFETEANIDYIIHGANITSSSSFVNSPVETINIAVDGTNHVMEIARRNNVKGIVFLSSMEVYGQPLPGQILNESEMGYIDPISIRSSYSESKRLCETLCVSYAAEYNLPVMIVRLTQTMGPGIEKNDNRVFAEFARNIIEKKDIVLLTEGKTERMYLYTADAATAILTVLTKGNAQTAYNAANRDSFCSVYEMACALIEEFGNGNKVVIKKDSINTRGFNPVNSVYMDMSKIYELGWKHQYSLMEMYSRMMTTMTGE